MAAPPSFASQAPSSMAKASEPNRNTRYDPSKPHITETPITKANWYKHVNWLNVFFIIGIPLMGCIAAFWTPLQWKTAVFAVAYYFMTGLGITAGV
jgi:stearoyl-CoA desaturase (delta-9 desaturase)